VEWSEGWGTWNVGTWGAVLHWARAAWAFPPNAMTASTFGPVTRS
jgi:hypothetical protein